MGEVFVHAALRASGRDGFLGAILRAYGEALALSDQGVAERLGCDIDGLRFLALCGEPRPDAQFASDIQNLAHRVGADPTALAQAVRLGMALRVLRSAPPVGLLVAARDHQPEDEG